MNYFSQISDIHLFIILASLALPLVGFYAYKYILFYVLSLDILLVSTLALKGSDIIEYYIPYLDGKIDNRQDIGFNLMRDINLSLGGNHLSFLVFSIVICVPVIYYSFKYLYITACLPNSGVGLAFSLFSLISLPVLAYHSPRSMIPFVILLISLIAYTKSQYKLSSTLPIVSILFHPQYLVASLIISFFSIKNVISSYKIRIRYRLKLSRLTLIVLLVFMLIGSYFAFPYLISIFPPSYTISILSEKYSSYTDPSSSYSPGLRLTSLFSILIMFISIGSFRYNTIFKPFNLIFDRLPPLRYQAIASGIINIMFVQNAHIAGRLSRFTDYLLIPLLMTCLLTQKSLRPYLPLLLIIYSFLAIFIYRSVYLS